MVKKMVLVVLLALISALPMRANAQEDNASWVEYAKLKRGEKDIHVSGDVKKGSFKIVKFTIPDNHILLDIKISVDSKAPFGGGTFLCKEKAGYRITKLDKFYEYHSTGQPGATFVIEAWARKSGAWFASNPTHITLHVVYYYYDLTGIDQEVFNQAVEYTLLNVHTIPVHLSTAELFQEIEKKDYKRTALVEEIVLNNDKHCTWGATPTCKDCSFTRILKDGRKHYRYIYNSKFTDGICP